MRLGVYVALATVLAAAVVSAKVHVLDEGVTLGEATQVHMKVVAKAGVKAKRMWTKMDASTPPQGTVTYKTINDVEQHGKCRFACYQDKMCGGYAFTPGTHTCKLLSAPNFLADKAANDKWHKQVSFDHTGADYEPDKEEEKEKKNLKGALKQVPKRQEDPKDPPKKVGDEGHLHLDLETKMNEALEQDQTEHTNEDNESIGMDDATLAHLKHFKTGLYQEFYEKYAHEYEHRAEACAARKAHKLAEKRAAKHNLLHPKNRLKDHQVHLLYVQARKEVDYHCIRKFQRSFKTRLTAWGSEQIYDEQERLKNKQDKQEMAEKEAEEEMEKKEQEEALAGKSP